MTTVLDEAPKSIRVQNWLTIFEGEEDLFELLMDSEDTADEITGSKAAMRVVFRLDLVEEGE